MLQTPISLSSSVLAAVCSSVLTLTLYLGWPMRRADGAGADLQQVRAGPGASGCSCIQTTWASNWSATAGGDVGRGEHVAAADVDLVGEGERDRLAGDGLVEVAVER